MPIIINKIQKNSLAHALNFKKNYTILSINKQPVNDILDLMFLTQKNKFSIEYKDDKNNLFIVNIKNNFDKPLGIEVELSPCQLCINNCIFCFIDQLPKELRSSLYVKDDDYLYSFFYGNFITLTNLSEKDINKIITQRISPLYVSVHTTDQVLHKKMLRYETDFDIMSTLKIFQENNIQLHTQIVLVPGYNDGDYLCKTIDDLAAMHNIISIGVVPVGTTKFRSGDFQSPHRTDGVSPSKCSDGISPLMWRSEIAATGNGETPLVQNIPHLYFADEFYVRTQTPIPDADHYNDFPQIENGIGMIRKSWENWKKNKKKHLKKLQDSPVFITSISGSYAIKPIVNEIPNARMIIIKNNFFGHQVTVTGLLTWSDISEQMILNENEYPVFSSAIFNHEMKTLDGFTPQNIENFINKKIVIINELF